MVITEKELREAIKSAIRRELNLEEGIDFDPKKKEVSYNPSHEDNVDTSVENNPTKDDSIVPNVAVWSIFKRKKGNVGDGNPLIYAMKGEGWKFRSFMDKYNVERQINLIAEKFVSMYRVGITILVPSGSHINKYIADVVMKKAKDAELIEGVICKMTTEEVHDIVLYDDNCKFRKYYKDNFNEKYYQLCRFLETMNTERKGAFSRHLIKDAEMRNVLDFTLKASKDRYAEFANKINGQNVLIIDDTISRGQTIVEACNIIKESYAPKTMTVLTLLSQLK